MHIQKKGAEALYKYVGVLKGIGARIHALWHMDVPYAGNAAIRRTGAIAGQPFGLRCAHRQFAMHKDVPARRSGERPPGELVEPEPFIEEEADV